MARSSAVGGRPRFPCGAVPPEGATSSLYGDDTGSAAPTASYGRPEGVPCGQSGCRASQARAEDMLRALSGLSGTSKADSSVASPTSASNIGPTRLVQVKVPQNALENDIIFLETEQGVFQVPLSKRNGTMRPGKMIHVDIPVPLDFAKTKKLDVQSAKLYRGGVEVSPPVPTAKMRVAIPGSAKPRDVLTVHTAIGAFDFNVPDAHGPTINVELPLDAADAAELGGQPLRATKILLNGVDIAAMPAQLKRNPGTSADKVTRRVVFQLPKNVATDDTLEVCTELGLYQIKVPRNPSATLEAHLPVPPGCDLATLHVAWVRKVDATEESPAPATPRPATPTADAATPASGATAAEVEPAPPQTTPESDAAAADVIARAWRSRSSSTISDTTEPATPSPPSNQSNCSVGPSPAKLPPDNPCAALCRCLQ